MLKALTENLVDLSMTPVRCVSFVIPYFQKQFKVTCPSKSSTAASVYFCARLWLAGCFAVVIPILGDPIESATRAPAGLVYQVPDFVVFEALNPKP